MYERFYNPLTQRWIKTDSKLAKSILKNYTHDTILNPKSMKLISIESSVGRSVLKKYRAYTKGGIYIEGDKADSLLEYEIKTLTIDEKEAFAAILKSILNHFTSLMYGGVNSSKINQVQVRNFMAHTWLNKTQLVHFSTLSAKKEITKFLYKIFILIASFMYLQNIETLFYYLNPKIKELENTTESLVKSNKDNYISEFDISSSFKRLTVETFMNSMETIQPKYKNTLELFSIVSIGLIFFNLILGVVQIYKIVTHLGNKYDTEYINYTIVKNMAKFYNDTFEKYESLFSDNIKISKDAVTMPFMKDKQMVTKKGLEMIWEIYSNKSFKDVETFSKYAENVDGIIDKIDKIDKKYQYIFQPDGMIAIIKAYEEFNSDEKNQLKKVSEMLHAMHSAQQYVLKATHDPVERADINEFGYTNHIHTADKLGDEALRKFRETYEELFKNEIVFYTDEKTGFLKFREQLSQSRGGKKTKNKL